MKWKLPHRLFACCAACLTLMVQAAPAPVEVLPDAERLPVWSGLRVVVPAEADMAPDRAAALAAGEDGKSIDSPNRILGRGTLPFWGLFSLYNPEAQQLSRILALEATTQFDTRLFARAEDGTWRQVRSVADAAAGRIGGGSMHPVWELQLAPHQATELLLRVEGPAVVRFPVFLYQSARFAELERNVHIVIGIALGVCLFVVIYIGSLRRYLGDTAVPLFMAMILADLVGALWLSGFLREVFPAVPESVLSPIGCAAYAALFGFGCLHARVYLNCAAWTPKMDFFLLVFGWVWLTLAPVLSIAFPVGARVLLVWGGTMISVILVTVAVFAARRKVPLSGFIAAAWSGYLVAGIAFLIPRIIDDPLLWSSSALVLVQATVVAILFALAMSQRLLQQRDRLVAAHREAEMQGEKSRELMRERSLLFAATNHDLRQPLLGVSLFADSLKAARTPAERDAHASKLDMALKEVDDLLVGIQQLAAVHEASHSPMFESVKLDDLLAPIVEEYRGRSEKKRITIRYVASSQSIMTHVPYFQRIVRNVLSNAIRYSAHGDRILVGCRRGGGRRLVIADTGRGMSAEQTRRAFDAFQRFDAEKSIADGFGLGLFSTKSLANALGVSVSLRSLEGRGTEFRIMLPPVGEFCASGTGTD